MPPAPLYTRETGRSWMFYIAVQFCFAALCFTAWRLLKRSAAGNVLPVIIWMLAAPQIHRLWRGVRKRTKIAKPGICESCGYNISATLNRCPECGQIPTVLPSPADIADYKQSFQKLSTRRLRAIASAQFTLPLEVQVAARELLAERDSIPPVNEDTQ